MTFFVTTHYMDEAERCSHVGYIYFSKLIVCGTPNELKQLDEISPPGTARLEVRCPRLPSAMRILAEKPYVDDVTIFADSLHVLAEQGSEHRISADLEAAGYPQTQVIPIPPTLEDVFVTLTQRRKAV